MFKKSVAWLLMFSQAFSPIVSNAGLLDGLFNDIGSAISSIPISSKAVSHSEALKRGNDALLVFSDGDALTYDPNNKASAEAKWQQYQQAKKLLENKTNLNYDDLVKFGNAIRPYISYLENVERIKQGGDLVLQPGQTVSVEAGAFCADPGVSAPDNGSVLKIVDNGEIVPEKARKLYKGLMKYSLENPDQRAMIQQQVHDIKNIQKSPRFLLGAPSAEKKKYFNKIIPNGGKEYDDYVKWAIAKADNGEKRETQTLEESVAKWSPSSNVGGLEFKAKDKGGAAESVVVQASNSTNAPIPFNPVNFAAVPDSKVKQRLAMTGASNIYSNGGDPYIDPTHVKLVEAVVNDATEFLGQRTVEFGTKAMAIYPAKSMVVRNLLSGAPIASSVIGAWELYSGRNFFTGKELSSAEKVLSALSIVPSAGFITKAVGAGVLPMLEKYALSNMAARKVGEVMTSDTAEYYADNIYNQQITNADTERLAQEALVAYANDPTTPAAAQKMLRQRLG